MTDEKELELAEAVAEKVMGWHQCDDGQWITGNDHEVFSCYSWKTSSIRPLWRPASILDHSWMVMNRMKKLGYGVLVNSNDERVESGKWPDVWHANFSILEQKKIVNGYGPTPMVAICRTALEAVQRIHALKVYGGVHTYRRTS